MSIVRGLIALRQAMMLHDVFPHKLSYDLSGAAILQPTNFDKLLPQVFVDPDAVPDFPGLRHFLWPHWIHHVYPHTT